MNDQPKPTPHYLDKTGVRVRCVSTKTGIYIGCAYQSPIRQLSFDETLIQSALLASGQRSLPVWAWLTIYAAVGLCVFLITK